MKHCRFFFLAFGFGLAQAASADSTLEYLLAEDGQKTSTPHPVIIKDGKVMVRGVGGDQSLDVIYSRAPELLFIIDHRKHNVMALDENQIDRLAQQTETVQPLLAGFGEQLAKLNSKQRAKWEQMLGGKIDLKAMAEATKPLPASKIVKTGHNKDVAGIACEQMNVFQGKSKTVEFCLADPAKLNISGEDYATIRALLGFSERLAAKTQGLAKQFGVSIPNIDLGDLSGVPIEMRDMSAQSHGSLKLSQIAATTIAQDAIQLPNGYPVEPFKLW